MKTAISNASTNTAQHSAPASRSLTREQIAGNFSLIANRPIVIDSIPGVILEVRSGLIQVCHPEHEGQHLLQGGQAYTLNRNGPVGLAAINRAEVRLEWPVDKTHGVTTTPQRGQLFARA